MTTTIEDLALDGTLSGYRGVQVHPDPHRAKRYRVNNPGRLGATWGTFPWRETAEEAARDQIDFVLGLELNGARHVVRGRRAAQGWFDVVKEDGNEWIDTPPSAPQEGYRRVGPRKLVEAPERDFMLTERFQKAVHNLPADCVAEAKASSALSALQYGTGQVLVKRALRGLKHLPAYLLVPTEPHPDHRRAVEDLGVEVIVP